MATTHILAFDVETTGPDVKKHFCCEFGAALVEIRTGKEMWRFHSYCKPPPSSAGPQGTWDQATLDEFWLTKAKDKYDAIIAALPTAPIRATAMKRFVTEVRIAVTKNVPSGSEGVIVISDTAGFDCSWMESMLKACLDDSTNCSSMRSLCDETKNKPLRDVNSWYLGIAREPLVASSSASGSRKKKPLELACDALGIGLPTTSCEHSHNPADDSSHMAQCAAYVIRAMETRRKVPSGSFQSVIGTNNTIGIFNPKAFF